uniref:Uncharacterized protein n=1 Tax=Anguilla anguilla TaxID=7936 RepID=A0A0E9WFC7_ANGAN
MAKTTWTPKDHIHMSLLNISFQSMGINMELVPPLLL